MAKSMLHAVVGLLVADGRLDLDGPAPVAAWSDPGDPRHAITLRRLLEMRPGLQWAEVYEADGASDVVEMLFSNDFSAVHDTAAFAAGKPLAVEPGTRFNYSSGTSNIVSGIVADEVGRGEPYRQLLRDRLFGPLGMASASPTFDPSGTWIASSYCYCTARDFARFGQLYLDGGVSGGTRLLPADWVATAFSTISRDEEGAAHSMHWWQMFADRFPGSGNAAGYEGQLIVIVPSLELVAVRLGQTTAEDRTDLLRLVGDVIDTCA
jgi:CubicO group peptidase (beta-lactamase class C family)